MFVIFLLVLLPAAVDWLAVARDDQRLERVAKPATIAVLIVATAVAWSGDFDRTFIATMVALVLSLAGDVFLMGERDRFVHGLIAFFAAHVAYIVAFGGVVLSPYSVFLGTSLVLIGGPLYIAIRQGLRKRDKPELIFPVLAYVFVISCMVMAALTAPGASGWTRSSIIAAATGALLFYGSDALIGLHRFVRELRWAPLAIIVTYHLGQIGLAYSLAIQAG
jgi:uncharacterized membrane protein YhhN